jgi:hypothetical protein
VGFGLSDPRTVATALFTNFTAANLADADALTIATPTAIEISKTSRSVRARVLKVEWIRIEVESDFMGALL